MHVMTKCHQLGSLSSNLLIIFGYLYLFVNSRSCRVLQARARHGKRAEACLQPTHKSDLYQGTASAVPQAASKTWALAPEGASAEAKAQLFSPTHSARLKPGLFIKQAGGHGFSRAAKAPFLSGFSRWGLLQTKANCEDSRSRATNQPSGAKAHMRWDSERHG